MAWSNPPDDIGPGPTVVRQMSPRRGQCASLWCDGEMRGRLTRVACVALACLGAWPALAAACPRAADGDDCDWVGTPTYISGTSVYSHGEFVYSDYVHD